MHQKSIPIILIVAIVLAGCNLISPRSEPTTIPTDTPALVFAQPTPLQPVSPLPPLAVHTVSPATPTSSEKAVLDRATAVVAALKDKDMSVLASYVHPQLGLRFSPYAAVRDNDLVFPADKVAGLMADTKLYNWGDYSSTGLPIELTFADYFAKFVYDVDFANAPQVALNQRLGVSTTLDNSHEFYPHAMIVEFYFSGFDPQLEGMDWRSLRLVFQQDDDTWYLVDIIHDQWTT